MVVYNRVDCCSDRLNNAVRAPGALARCLSGAHARGLVALQDVTVDGQLCGTIGAAASVNTISCGNKIGRAVKVQLQGTNSLTLCEVEVYGSAGSHTVTYTHRHTHTL